MGTGTAVELSALHHAIVEFIIEHGFAPTAAELGVLLGVPPSAIDQGLAELQDDHGVVLHPGSSRIWVIHPFSTAPTSFVVRWGEREWWAPCAWCALGAAALLGGDVDIVTTLGASGSQATLSIRDGEVHPRDLVVHFPVPMRRAWDNVVYSCSTMLLFDSEEAVGEWADRHRIGKGSVQSVSVVWELAKTWYGRHRDPDWRKWTVEEAREIFTRLGLEGEIWDLPDGEERF